MLPTLKHDADVLHLVLSPSGCLVIDIVKTLPSGELSPRSVLSTTPQYPCAERKKAPCHIGSQCLTWCKSMILPVITLGKKTGWKLRKYFFSFFKYILINTAHL